LTELKQITDCVYAAVGTIAALLDRTAFPADERAARQLPAHRAAEYLAARTLLRCLVSEVAGNRVATSPLGAHRAGQPFLTARSDIGISLSHTDGWVAAAVHLRGQVGVDVQVPVPASGRLVRRCCTPSALAALAVLPQAERDLEFARIWSVQESCVKATGRGIAGLPWMIPVEVGQTSGNWLDVLWSAPHPRLPVAFGCAYRTWSPRARGT
jgi:4'-phosphopantetheinyl transferase